MNFLQERILADINNEHAWVDGPFFQFRSGYHFDSCAFREGTTIINQRYDRLLRDLNPNHPSLSDAPDKFGQLLHLVQDFYAHSNWVELGKKGLIDDSNGRWTILNPFSLVKGVYVVEGTPPSGFALSPAGKVITVITPGGVRVPGLISGTAYPTDRHCPSNVAIGHWDTASADRHPGQSGFGTGLNKDLNRREDPRPGFEDARKLAIAQTTHEWCRLLSLVKQTYSQAGLNILLNNWANDRNRAISICE